MDFDRLRREVEQAAPAPLHIRVRQALDAQIEDGSLQPGAKLPSERTLQRELGVSRATVRQALGYLVQADRLESVSGIGTFVAHPPNPEPGLGLVGLIVSRPNFHFFYPQLAAEFSAHLHQEGYGTTILMHNEESDILLKLVRDLLRQGVRALAITPPRYSHPDHIDDLAHETQTAGVPVVLIGRRVERHPELDCIATDNRGIGYLATNHLLELGHRHIVHIGMVDYQTGQKRAQGYYEAMRDAALPCYIVELSETLTELHTDAFSPSQHLAEPGAVVARAVWNDRTNPTPTAAFCFNDATAMGVYRALRSRGLQVPEDVSLVGVDDLVTTRNFEVPLTTFALPGEEIGRQSAQLLLRRLAGHDDIPQTRLLTAPILKRRSTARLK